MSHRLLPLTFPLLMLLAGSLAYTGHELPPMGWYVLALYGSQHHVAVSRSPSCQRPSSLMH